MEGFALAVQIDLTLACNLKCDFCYAKINKNDLLRTNEQFSFQKLKSIFDTLRENPPDIPVKLLAFTGTGEPLLYKQLPEAVSYAKREIPYVEIVTNGVLLTKEISESLVDAGINEIQISITGASPEVYVHHQGSGKSSNEVIEQYDTVKKNVEDLCHLRNRKKASLNIFISYILHEGSEMDYGRCLNMWRDVGVDSIYFRPKHSQEPLLSEDYEEYIKSNFDTAKSSATSCLMFGKVQIAVNGDLHFCCYLQHEHTRLGNIFETSVTEIIDSERFKYLIDAFHGQYKNVPELCKTCRQGRFLWR